MKILVIIDMQNDFVTGSLGTKEAEKIIQKISEKIKTFDGKIFFTRDTHSKGYLDTQEGKKLPVEHCIYNTEGWQICSELIPEDEESIFDKPTFGSLKLAEKIKEINETIESITLVGVCTDICVISNAILLKAYLPEVPIIVDSSCCAGVNKESHNKALDVMEMCQIDIVR